MTVAQLFVKLLPLYLNIFLGWLAGKKLQANQETITKMVFYIINPLIIFNGVYHTPIDSRILSLPILIFFIASTLCLVFYYMTKGVFQGSARNITAFSAGSGATGYFGLPVAMMLFPPQTQGFYIMGLLGISLYDNTLGYYMSVKGTHSRSACLKKVVRLPTLYAFGLGLFANYIQVPLPEIYHEFIGPMKGVYIVLGMMIIGLGLAGLKSFKFDLKFIGFTFLAKFLAWPVIIISIIVIDEQFFGVYEPAIYQVLLLISIVPLAVNMVLMASLADFQTDQAAGTVLLSTLFAIFYIPLMSYLFMHG